MNTITVTLPAVDVTLPMGRDVPDAPHAETFSVRDVAGPVGYYQPEKDDPRALAAARTELRGAYDNLFHELSAPDASGGRVRSSSLFIQLEEAIGNSTGGGSGAGAAANTRTPINAAAFDTLSDLRRAVHGMLSELRLPFNTRDLSSAIETLTTHATLIRDWRLPATLAKTFRHFAQRIRSLLFPSRVIEVMVPCGNCGARKTVEGQSALTCRLDGTSSVPTVRCSVCRTEWSTEEDLRALAAGALV